MSLVLLQLVEKLIASDSAETGGLIENSGNTDITIGSGTDSIRTERFSDARQVFMDDDDTGQDFTADFVLETSGETGQIILMELIVQVVMLEIT